MHAESANYDERFLNLLSVATSFDLIAEQQEVCKRLHTVRIAHRLCGFAHADAAEVKSATIARRSRMPN